jgi:hypothetical protein
MTFPDQPEIHFKKDKIIEISEYKVTQSPMDDSQEHDGHSSKGKWEEEIDDFLLGNQEKQESAKRKSRVTLRFDSLPP